MLHCIKNKNSLNSDQQLMLFYEIMNIISEKSLLTRLLLHNDRTGIILIYLMATSQTFDKREVPAGPLIDKVTTKSPGFE